MTIDTLEAELLRLPRSARARLAERLISSLDEDSEIEQAWEEVAEHRYQQYLAGDMDTVPVDEAMAEIRSKLSQ